VKNLLTKEQLINFENEIADCFKNKMIKAPIHLQDNNAEQLIEVFKDVNEEDWCCGTWRFHFECLLKGVSRDKLKQAVLDGRSISLCFKEYRILCSAIVGAIIPISLGIAMDIKRKKQTNKVWCFVGEMSSTTGIFREAIEYAKNWDLPIVFVVSDNGKSVCTDTRRIWNIWKLPYEPDEVAQGMLEHKLVYKSKFLYYYRYKLDWPHAGSGARINF
jgi:TPP-dependent pyruvate/acetoin dehydrogenase alpha subunit